MRGKGGLELVVAGSFVVMSSSSGFRPREGKGWSRTWKYPYRAGYCRFRPREGKGWSRTQEKKFLSWIC